MRLSRSRVCRRGAMVSDNRRVIMAVTALVAVGAGLRLQMYLFD